MKKIVIIGASGFGKEVAWLIERINQKEREWEIIGFVDDNETLIGQSVSGHVVLGTTEILADFSNIYVVCAVGASKVRKRIIEKVLNNNSKMKFATLIDPSVIMSRFVKIGEGTIICAGSIITVDIEIGKHVIINLDCTVGHDAKLDDFVTLYPSVNVSGFAYIGECVELGTGTQIIQTKSIANEAIVGAGSVVVKDLPSKCTAVGIPAKPIKYFE